MLKVFSAVFSTLRCFNQGFPREATKRPFCVCPAGEGRYLSMLLGTQRIFRPRFRSIIARNSSADFDRFREEEVFKAGARPLMLA